MKLTKSLFMLCAAGLSLCACNSDEKVNQLPDGVGMVEVKVYSPETKTVTTGSPDGTIEVTGPITVTLYATFVGSDGKTESTPAEGMSVVLDGTNTAKFWNVKNPTKVTASVHGGTDTYASIAINDATMQVAPASIPAYGEATPSLSNESQSPQLGGAADEKVNANEGDNNKTYQVYKASIAMKIPVARLEVSGLSLNSGSEYTSLTLDGVYLDHISVNGPSWSGDGFKTFASNPQNYAFAAGEGTGFEAILKDPVDEDFVSGTYPATGVYAYNFYGAPEGTTTSDANAETYNPSFKMYFSTGTKSPDNVIYPRFAFIKRFKDGAGKTVVLENGYVYKSTGAELVDDNIIGDEG
ncbi:MAG: hypothetical protein J6V02_01385, partial [Bacteroidaceae bacterium]|nr:hypothetical protein [Bacteroidaceae bacterium]